MDPQNQLVIYQSEDGTSSIECRLLGDTLWLSLNQIADLFERDKSVISKHLKNIFEDGELERDATVANHATVQNEGTRQVEREIDFYNLEAIFAVGYRIRSTRGAQFRNWATAQLKEYLVSGVLMDDERLKDPDSSILFERILGRIRDIRSSEKIFWRKICDIFATSLDYDGKNDTARAFFSKVQNKMHWAVHGSTAAEVIHTRVDSKKPHLGTTHFKGSEPTRSEITVAKNYLAEDELDLLNRIVTAYLEFAEIQAIRRRPMHMADWASKLDDFLRLGDHDLLTTAGKISAKQAKEKALLEYEKFRKTIDLHPTQIDKDLEAAIKKLKAPDKK